MYQVDRDITDVEIIDAFYEIIGLLLKGYNEPIREGFSKKSRAEQVGYDLTMCLIRKDIIHVGQKEEQQKLELEDRNEQRKDYQRAD